MSDHLPETIAFPDVEALLVEWIPTVLDGYPASTRIPNPRPDKFVRVLRSGGPRANLVTDRPQVTFEVWDVDSTAAAATAATLRAHVNALAGQVLDNVQIHRVQEGSGPGNLPDPVSDHARYTWSVVIDVRGQVLAP